MPTFEKECGTIYSCLYANARSPWSSWGNKSACIEEQNESGGKERTSKGERRGKVLLLYQEDD